MSSPVATAAEVVGFWREAGPAKWFSKDDAFDAEFDQRFRDAHFAAARRELDGWAGTAEGTLALLVLLDQFPRNVFRGTGHAFATDPLARHFAREALATGRDRQVEPALRLFCYLPFQHHEDAADQDRAVELMRSSGMDAKWALHHREIIRRFGRFPHRNAALGRESTAEEIAFLRDGGFTG